MLCSALLSREELTERENENARASQDAPRTDAETFAFPPLDPREKKVRLPDPDPGVRVVGRTRAPRRRRVRPRLEIQRRLRLGPREHAHEHPLVHARLRVEPPSRAAAAAFSAASAPVARKRRVGPAHPSAPLPPMTVFSHLLLVPCILPLLLLLDPAAR